MGWRFACKELMSILWLLLLCTIPLVWPWAGIDLDVFHVVSSEWFYLVEFILAI